MVSLKRTIAALIVCFKPHVLLSLCILLVIAQSIVIAVKRGVGSSWRLTGQNDLTLAMTTLVLVVALIWLAFFIIIVRFELRNELDSLLTLFQCSKRGLRLLGVIGFHVALLLIVSLIVSATVERSIPVSLDGDTTTTTTTTGQTSRPAGMAYNHTTTNTPDICQVNVYQSDVHIDAGQRMTVTRSGRLAGQRDADSNFKSTRANPVHRQGHNGPVLSGHGNAKNVNLIDRNYMLTVYKIWLTAIVYAFLYLIIENLVMFYADMSLVEFVHISFLTMVAKLTGIDLSDYPAGEMLFNPLIRHRIR
jgi:hypothetical protein